MNVLGRVLNQVTAHNKILEQDKMWKEKERKETKERDSSHRSKSCILVEGKNAQSFFHFQNAKITDSLCRRMLFNSIRDKDKYRKKDNEYQESDYERERLMNAHRKLKNQVKTLQDVNNDCWINDKYFYQHVSQDDNGKEVEQEDQQLILENSGSGSEREIGPPNILKNRIEKEKKNKKEEKEKKEVKKKKKKDKKNKKEKKEKKLKKEKEKEKERERKRDLEREKDLNSD